MDKIDIDTARRGLGTLIDAAMKDIMETNFLEKYEGFEYSECFSYMCDEIDALKNVIDLHDILVDKPKNLMFALYEDPNDFNCKGLYKEELQVIRDKIDQALNDEDRGY